MQTLRISPDQWTAVGQSMSFMLTDIDAAGVRVIVRGQIIGGPEDGARIDRPYEIAVGGDARVGLVTLALIDTRPATSGGTAKLGVYCPQHLPIRFVKEPT